MMSEVGFLEKHGADVNEAKASASCPLIYVEHSENEEDVMSTESKTPAERVRFILGHVEDEGGAGDPHHPAVISLDEHQLFIQMDILVHFDEGRLGWKEQARWLKYEETVETGDRWSKPHVPTPTMHGFLELRRALVTSPDDVTGDRMAVSFDSLSAASSVIPAGGHKIVDALMATLRQNEDLGDEIYAKIEHIVLEPHKHLHRHAAHRQGGAGGAAARGGSHHLSTNHLTASNTQTTLSVVSTTPEGSATGPDEFSGNVFPTDSKSERQKLKMFKRREGSGINLASAYYSYPEGCSPDNLKPYKPNKKLTKKLPPSCESANILVGQVDFLPRTVMALCRLESLSTLSDLTEVNVPTRFIFLVLGSASGSSIWELAEIGRSMAALLNDKIFCEVAYKAKTRDDLVYGLDEFLDDVLVLPPSLWDPATRLEPPRDTISIEKIRNRLEDSTRHPNGAEDSGAHKATEGGSELVLRRTGRMFGGLIADVRRRYPLYWTDLKDGLHLQCLASTIFLFFACITPIVTFGGLMGQKTDGYLGTMETLLSGFICGVLYAIFSGQPLTIIGSTGPLLVFESILYHMTKENQIDFLSFRFWIGVWVALALLVVVLLDLSAYVCYITRFTEECFSILISAIFIVEAFSKIHDIWRQNAVGRGRISAPGGVPGGAREGGPGASWGGVDPGTCHCVPSDSWAVENYTKVYRELYSNWSDYIREDCVILQGRISVRHSCMSESGCLARGWNLTGSACHVASITRAVPDVFFLSVILFVGTFGIAIFFRSMRTSRFFPSVVRAMLADFAVLIAIVTCTCVDIAFGIDTPKLNVPAGFKNTRPDRGWVVNPCAVTYWWLVPLSVLPAMLVTILIFLDQQITAVIVNRKEHKLVKGHGYHLDVFVLSILVCICSTLGLPWFVAATVRSIAHVKSLVRVSDTSLPGERPKMLGCREQRLTGISIHILIGMATLLTSVLGFIPMPVLYGVFLYMGVTSLFGIQFFERVLILFMPAKYQPDYIFLRHVRTSRVHCFTALQVACMTLMWVVKTVKVTAIAFPILLIALIVVRKLLDYVFTQSDLFWLDHLLPEAHWRHKEDKHKDIQPPPDPTPVRNVTSRRLSCSPAGPIGAEGQAETQMLERKQESNGMSPFHRQDRKDDSEHRENY